MASILDLPLDQVIDTACPEMRAKGFWSEIYRWLATQGLKLKRVDCDDPRLIGGYSIGVGPSPRGEFLHAVVCKNGKMVFDPHPSDDGVASFEYHDIFIPLNEAKTLQWQSRFRAEAEAANV